MTRTEAIKNFLTSRTHEDLASLYNKGMEVQVNVAADGGERVSKQGYVGPSGASYTNIMGTETWYSFRVPKNAKTTPEDNDHTLTFDLSEHAESIGLTGWNWEEKESLFFGFDFDAVMGHSDAHSSTLDAKELLAVEMKAKELDYVTVRRSTGGAGLHLYVFLETPIRTENHNQHAALGRAILCQMGKDVDFDFETKVDVGGSNMWVWHRKMDATEGLGLALLKKGGTLKDTPCEEIWRSHLDVIEKRVRKASIKMFDSDEEQSEYDTLSNHKVQVPLDSEHDELIEFLQTTDYSVWYEREHNRLVTHTCALKQAAEHFSSGKGSFTFKGRFETNSAGTHSEQNCFCFPLVRGGWTVIRFGKGLKEHSSWSNDVAGNTKCSYNVAPSIRTAAIFCNGAEDAKGNFTFPKAKDAEDAANLLGADVNLPLVLKNLPATLEQKKDGRLRFAVEDTSANGIASPEEVPDWNKTSTHAEIILDRAPGSPLKQTESEVETYDETLRFLIDETGRETGWAYKNSSDKKAKWVYMSKDNVKSALSLHLNAEGVKEAFSLCANNPFMLVNKPFKDLYPGGREWNKESAQAKFKELPNTTKLRYPTWQKVLTHLGKNLTPAIKKDRWCKENSILTGADYLKIWCSYMFRYPEKRLPYLFFYSPGQETGKSTLAEALQMLMTKGNYSAAEILKDKHNGALEGTVLCYLEEEDLGKNKQMYNRVKEYTTSSTLTIRPLYRAHLKAKNYTHWIHTANNLNYVPIEPGDTRVIVIVVDSILPENMINENVLKTKLRQEAPAFYTEIMNLELPPPARGRMPMPVLKTPQKERAMSNLEDSLEGFLKDYTFYTSGATITLKEFMNKFNQFGLDDDEKATWNIKRVQKSIAQDLYPKGKRSKDNQVSFGNISFDPDAIPTQRLVCNKQNKLVEEEIT